MVQPLQQAGIYIFQFPKKKKINKSYSCNFSAKLSHQKQLSAHHEKKLLQSKLQENILTTNYINNFHKLFLKIYTGKGKYNSRYLQPKKSINYISLFKKLQILDIHHKIASVLETMKFKTINYLFLEENFENTLVCKN